MSSEVAWNLIRRWIFPPVVGPLLHQICPAAAATVVWPPGRPLTFRDADFISDQFYNRVVRDATALEDFIQAIERIVAGLEKKSRILGERERGIVAHHEMGHALVAMSLPGTDPVQKVSIIPRGLAALGYTMQRPAEDRFLIGRNELENRLTVLLGGRAAETLFYKEVSTGAADDLVRATDIARDMVVRFGMDKGLGQVSYEPERGSFLVGQTPVWRPRTYSEQTTQAIDVAIREQISLAFHRALLILEANRPLVEEAAQDLLKHETLSGSDLTKYAKELKTPAPAAVAAA